MGEKGWSNTSKFPPRMKIKRSTHKPSRRVTRELKQARQLKEQTVEIPVTPSKPTTIRQLGKQIAERRKLRTYPSNRTLKEEEKPVLTHRARRMAQKCFPKRKHDWKLSLLIPRQA